MCWPRSLIVVIGIPTAYLVSSTGWVETLPTTSEQDGKFILKMKKKEGKSD